MDPMTPLFPTADAALVLSGPAGGLQAQVEFPEPGVAACPVVAVVCHPLPTGGGTMDNKVVTMVARSLRELGITTVRFNFRGTGQSQGGFDHGAGETADLAAVVAWVHAQRPGDALWLAGFSFGSYVSLRMNAALAPTALISIAPPVGRWDFAHVPVPAMPWLVVQGDEDELVDANAVQAWVEASGAPDATLQRLPGTSHFFHGKLLDLRTRVQDWARPRLPA